MKQLKENIILAVLVTLFIVFCACMLFAVLYPVGAPETKTALYIGLGCFLSLLGFMLFNLD